MSDDTIFGPSVGKFDVETAVRDHLRAWMPTELARFARKYGYPTPPKVRGFTTRNSFEKWPEDQVPLVIINAGGTIDDSLGIDGSGAISGAWRVEIAVLVSANTEANTKRLASCFGEAVREAIVQHGSLSDFAERSAYRGEDYDARVAALPEEADRTEAAVGLRFAVYVRDIANRLGGPTEPLEAPYSEPDDWPTVDEDGAEVEVAKT